jgi:hypothetical protein
MQQRVSFHDSVLMYVDKLHSLKDRQAMFYSREEMREFGEEILLHARLCKSMRNGESSCMMNTTDYCVRGLEEYFDEDRMIKKRKQRVLAHLAVFLEQDRQYLEEGLFTPEDSDTLAHRYRQITRHAEREARQGALIYATGIRLTSSSKKVIFPSQAAGSPSILNVTTKACIPWTFRSLV